MSPTSRSWLSIAAAIAAVMVLVLVAFPTLRGLLAGHPAAAPSSAGYLAGALRVAVTPAPASPRVGENHLELRLADAAGAPVDGAEVHVGWKMAAMGAMPEMRGSAAAEPRGPGEYRARVDLPMNGTWRLEIDVRPAAGEAVRLEGSLTTGAPGVALAASPGAGAARPEAAASGEIRIDAERRQRVGIRTARVERGPLELSVRAVGRVTVDETALVDVSMKTRGWITRLDVASLGAPVRKGEVLFSFYSPELFAAQQELLQALRSQSAASGGSAPERADPLVRVARKRLALWDIANADVDAVIRRGEPQDSLPVRSAASGYVIEKDVVEGGAVEPGARLFRIAPLDRVWIEAAIQESEVPLVAVGQHAQVSLPSLPGETLTGSVAYVYPTLEADTRTGRIRIVLENPEGKLLPDMYANVELRVDRGEKLLVPASAVLYAGPRRIVFVDLGEGRLAPRAIDIGAGNGEVDEVLSGLEAGETVVSSGNFLVASESRLESALSQW
jgi:membrane fusion protein, copper/silver efflux system